MMVSISGERGVGKTLFLAERVHLRRKAGYFTITNFSHADANLDCSGLSPEEFLSVILNVIDFKDAGYEMFNIHPSFRHTGVYVAMDEATIYFSPEMQSRLSKSNPEQYMRLLNLLAQARKYDVEIDYVVQDPAKVGKDFRRYTEHFIYLRWLFKIKFLANVPHPRLPIFRREHRHVLDIIWLEIHELDAENPVRNYRTVRDENGVAQWTEASTLKHRSLRLTGMFKRHILRMYNSYQAVGVKQEMYQKEYSPLRGFKVIQGQFEKERFPTFKRFFNFFGFRFKLRDAHLPLKVGYPDIVLPPIDARNKIISEVQSQETITLTVDDLQKEIARAFSDANVKKGLFTRRTKESKLDKAASEVASPNPVVSPKATVLRRVGRPLGIKKYIKKNDPKLLLRSKIDQVEDFNPFPLPSHADHAPSGNRPKMVKPARKGRTKKSNAKLQDMPGDGSNGVSGSPDNMRMHSPSL